LLPDWAILDPELTLGLPARVAAATAIDAMVHAIEAYE
jgi:alcohol dehydrogenase class IV